MKKGDEKRAVTFRKQYNTVTHWLLQQGSGYSVYARHASKLVQRDFHSFHWRREKNSVNFLITHHFKNME